MVSENVKVWMISVIVLLNSQDSRSILWNRLQCSRDAEQSVPEGSVADIGRFPWLGVVQHSFYVGGATRFAITGGVLIHPAYAIAPAEDMSKILPEELSNNTRFILWHSASIKYAIEVHDYILHPEYEERGTFATLALLELSPAGETGVGANPSPVLPVCMPVSGGGTFTDLYAVKMTDENVALQKEVYKMAFVDDKNCQEFYYKNMLSYKKMAPVAASCAKVERSEAACVWDGGAALVTRQDWGFWKLLGFSVRGPGCGAPARFLDIMAYMPWINDMLTIIPEEQLADVTRLGVRRLSPIKIVLYNADKIIPKEQGQCERKQRGHVLYKDVLEVLMTKNFGQGFFFVVIHQIASFYCAIVNMEEVTAKSNVAMWMEHYCHREITGLAHGQKKPRNYRKQECFLYFKSAAFVQFRFYFSFRAYVEVSVFGEKEITRFIPDPFKTDETTDSWWPTDKIIRTKNFASYALWYWYQ